MKIKNMITIIMILAMVMMMTNKMISKKSMYINKKMNPIECGFEKMILKNMPLYYKKYKNHGKINYKKINKPKMSKMLYMT